MVFVPVLVLVVYLMGMRLGMGREMGGGGFWIYER